MTDGFGWTGGPDGPSPSGPPLAHVLLVLFLGLCAVVLVGGTVMLLLGSREDPPPVTAQASPTPAPAPAPTPAPSGPAPSDTPRPSEPIGRRAELGDLVEQVAAIREIELRDPLDARVVGADALADKVSDLAFSEIDPDELAATERLLVALRLAEPGVALGEIVEDLYREQILGLYVPEEATLYVRRRGEQSPAQRMTTAHEITHALQDQAFDLVELQSTYEERDDAALAVLSLIEGDAVLTQQLWAQRHLSPDELQEAMAQSSGGDALAQAPDYLRESLFFPYAEGSTFVADLYRTGGYDAIDAAFANPPTSSEQIMHPDRYRDGDAPVKVRVQWRPGSGWQAATTYEFGEFDLDQLLQPLGADTAATAAQGWDGGSIRSWSDDGAIAVAARLRFDTAQDANEACAALPRWYAEVADGRSTGTGTYAGDRDHFAFRCFGDTVDFALAPSPETARKLTAAP